MIDKELIKRMEFESRIAEVIPMLKNEYHLYGTVRLIKDLKYCLDEVHGDSIYDKAVDDLTANIIERFSGMAMSSGLPTEGATWENAIRQVKQIAQQLKGAKQNENFKQEEIQ